MSQLSHSIVTGHWVCLARMVKKEKNMPQYLNIYFHNIYFLYLMNCFDSTFYNAGNIYTDTITFAHTKVGLSLNISTKEIFYHMGTEIQL